jgi:hypothetical protein
MTRLDLNAACNMACANLPEGWVLEIHLEKGVSLLGPVLAPTVPGRTSVRLIQRRLPDVEGHCHGQECKDRLP